MFEMGAQIATILAMVFAGWAILHSAAATKLQRNAIQTGLIADFYKRLSEIQEMREDYEEKGKIGVWCVQILGHLEYLAFMVNNKFI